MVKPEQFDQLQLVYHFTVPLKSWSQSLSGSPETSSQILSQLLWFNKYNKIEGTEYVFQNSLMKVLTSYHSYLKMIGSYHG